MSTPRVKDLFSIGKYSGPYVRVIQFLLRQEAEPPHPPLVEAGIHPLFFPWCDLQNGTMSRTALNALFARWSREGSEDLVSLVPASGPDDPFISPPPQEPNESREEWLKKPPRFSPPSMFDPTTSLPSEARWSPHPSVHREGAVHIYGGWRSDIDSQAALHHPLLMGTDCTIRFGSRLSWSVLGHGVRIGGRVSRSVIGDGTEIAPGAVIGDSVVGKNCLIGKVSFRSSDDFEDARKEIIICDARTPELRPVHTGRTVLGAIIGDNCRIFASLPPGIVIPEGSVVTQRMEGRLPAGVYTREILEEYDQLLAQREMCDLRTASKAASDRARR